MFNQKDILAALQSGQDPEEIANKFAAALNAAVAEKTEKETTQKNKLDLMDKILVLIAEYVRLYMPDLKDEWEKLNISAGEAVEAADYLYKDTLGVFKLLNDPVLKTKTNEDILKAFFR